MDSAPPYSDGEADYPKNREPVEYRADVFGLCCGNVDDVSPDVAYAQEGDTQTDKTGEEETDDNQDNRDDCFFDRHTEEEAVDEEQSDSDSRRVGEELRWEEAHFWFRSPRCIPGSS